MEAKQDTTNRKTHSKNTMVPGKARLRPAAVKTGRCVGFIVPSLEESHENGRIVVGGELKTYSKDSMGPGKTQFRQAAEKRGLFPSDLELVLDGASLSLCDRTPIVDPRACLSCPGDRSQLGGCKKIRGQEELPHNGIVLEKHLVLDILSMASGLRLLDRLQSMTFEEKLQLTRRHGDDIKFMEIAVRHDRRLLTGASKELRENSGLLKLAVKPLLQQFAQQKWQILVPKFQFEVSWQHVPKDQPLQENFTKELVDCLIRWKPHADTGWFEKFPRIIPRLEVFLYVHSSSKQDYLEIGGINKKLSHIYKSLICER